MRPWRVIPLGLIALVGSAGCGPGESGDTLSFGVLLPYTGSLAALGANLERAVVMAVEAVNDAGGIAGKELRPVFADTRSDPWQALAALEKLLDEEIIAVLGPEGGEVAEVLLPRLKEKQVLFISPFLVDSLAYQVSGGWPWFRLAPTATDMGEALAKRLIEKRQSPVAFIHTKDRYCEFFTEEAIRRYKELKGTVHSTTRLETDSMSYAAAAQKLPKTGGITIALVALPIPAARLITDIYVTRPYEHWKWYLSPNLKTPVFLENTIAWVLEGAEGVAPQLTADRSSFIKAYRERFVEDPLDGVLFYYDATAMLAIALQRAFLANDGKRPTFSALSASFFKNARRVGFGKGWNEIAEAFSVLQRKGNVYYTGLSGPILLDETTGARKLGAAAYWSVKGGEIHEED